MKKSKATKRTLLLSVLAMLLCMVMLVGTTFAWFTDSASTAVNKIQAGTLDVQLLDKDGNSLEGKTLNFVKAAGDEQILWEPGATYALPAIKIVNNGNLWLKYKVEVAEGITKKGEETSGVSLLDAIDFYVFDDNENIEGIIAAIAGGTATKMADYFAQSEATDENPHPGVPLAPSGSEDPSSKLLTIVGHMKETAGNEYQGLKLDGVAITVLATQYTEEYDSYDNQYDKNAEYAIPVATADELAAALANGQDVILTAPVKMPEVIEIKNSVTIYGGKNGQLLVPDNADRVINVTDNTEPVTLTLSNVDVVGPTTGTYTRGVSVYGNDDVTIVADNSSVSANYYALNIASENDNVKATIRNTTLTGWCAFQTWSAGTKATFENCTLIGNNDKGYNADGWNNFATVVINENTTGVELTFNNCRIEANQTTGNKQYLLSVRASDAKVTVDGCTFFANGTEIADEDLGNYLNIYSVASDLVLTIDGSVIPIE